MAFITIVNVISEGSLKKFEVDLRFCVCTTICDKIKMSTHKKLKFTLFTACSKSLVYKMFCHMCKLKLAEKGNKTVW